MKIVTGGAGFIGSNIVKALNAAGHTDILVVDDLSDGTKVVNLADCDIQDYMDKDDFLKLVQNIDSLPFAIDVVFHEGACSDTTEWDGKFMMKNNYEYSKDVLHYCMRHHIPFIYASSASVYGGGNVFIEHREYENPLNMYAYSKWQFDQYVRHILGRAENQIVGLRYFNVYGPREQHKGRMSSVAYHFNNQIVENGVAKLFGGCDGYGDGEQQRDFVYVGDVANVNLWFFDNKQASGIFNLGTGRAQSFKEVAEAVIEWHGKGRIEYMPFPDDLRGRYQSFTQADLSALRGIGYDQAFSDVASGVKSYLDQLNK